MSPDRLLAATKVLSEASLVAPYRLTGLQALSVLSATTCFTWLERLDQTTFSAPMMLVWMHSEGLYSAAGTCFRAAAWITMSTPRRAKVRRERSRTSPRKKRILA